MKSTAGRIAIPAARHRPRWIGGRAIAVALALMPVAPAAAQLLVVRASGPSSPRYGAGTMIARDAVLALKADDLVEVMDGTGTRLLRGPGNVPARGTPRQAPPGFGLPAMRQDNRDKGVVAAIAANETADGENLASLMERWAGQSGRNMARIGAVRGIVPAANRPLPSLFAIDVDGTGSYCITDTSPVTLWRADASAARTVALAAGAVRTTVTFAAGEAAVPWPATLAPTAVTMVTATSGEADAQLTIKPLTPDPQDLGALIRALASNGCSRQVAFLRAEAAKAR